MDRIKFYTIYFEHIKRVIALLITTILISSCLGTVEDVAPDTNKIAEVPTAPINFYGITRAVPISSSAVEVYFTPAIGLKQEDIVYLIRYDGLANIITIPATILPPPDYRGELHYTVRNLDSSRVYTFSVQAKSLETGQESSSFVTYTAQPFQTVTADFAGIRTLSNTAGPSGKYSLQVSWFPAVYSGAFSGLEIDSDPMYYEIILLESDKLTPSAFDDERFGPDDGRLKFYVNRDVFSTTIAGLKPGTEYHVMVRCYNKLYVDNITNEYYKKEINHEYLTLSTFSEDAADIHLIPESVTLTNPPGVDGKNSIDVSWAPIIGMIDHVRVYYYEVGNSFTIDSKCLIDSGAYHCKAENYNATSATLRDLIPGGEYGVTVVACVTFDCSSNIQFLEKQISVVPTLAQFYGIQDIESPYNVDELRTIHLKILPPDTSSGTIDGLLVRYYKNSPDNIYELNNPVADNTQDIIVKSFDPYTANDIAVEGIDPSSPDYYCFSVIPYTYESATTIHYDTTNEFFRCFIPNPVGEPDKRMLKMPNAQYFTGISNITFNSSTDAFLMNWSLPPRGIFDQQILIWREKQLTANLFNYQEALSGTNSDYHVIDLPASATSYALYMSSAQLPASGSSKTYEFGLLTRYQLYSLFYTITPGTLEDYSALPPVKTITVSK